MDGYGRFLPSPERFPSAANGAGFGPLAAYVHSKGLKFGIHIMRGIPVDACLDNLPILGSRARAREIADTGSKCPWLANYLYGVDAGKPGAQEYYNSLLKLYAGWGVDYLKVDDIAWEVYRAGEIELFRKAIDRCGRPIVLSLSPGNTPLGRARHVEANADLWRISNDVWDNWPDVLRAFSLLDAWTPWAENGRWPDADMLPMGRLNLKAPVTGPQRDSRLSWEEQTTLMTLWSIARSPLMIGGDLMSSPERSLSFFKNREVIEVNQHSSHGRQIRRNDSYAVWLADAPTAGDKYLALFNLTNTRRNVSFHLAEEELRGRWGVRDLWTQRNLAGVEGDIAVELDPHGAALYRLSARGVRTK